MKAAREGATSDDYPPLNEAAVEAAKEGSISDEYLQLNEAAVRAAKEGPTSDEYPYESFHAPDAPILFHWQSNTELTRTGKVRMRFDTTFDPFMSAT